MPKFIVTVEFTETKRREVTVFARDEQEAEEKAVDRVTGWDGVTDADAVEVERDDG